MQNKAYVPADISRATVMLLLDGNGIDKQYQLQQEIADLFEFNYHKPPITYPYHQYLKLAEFIRLKVYPNLRYDQAYEEIGYRAIHYYFDNSKAGPILKGAARIMGPEHGTKQFLKNIRTTLAWGQHEFEEIRSGYARYRIKFVAGPPALMRGILKASLEITGAKLVNIHSTVLIKEEDVIHEIEWS